MKKIKIYLDTSVINFLIADDVPEFRKVTEDSSSQSIITVGDNKPTFL